MRDGFIDVSRTLSEQTAVWPGDTEFSRKWVMEIEAGSSANTSTYTLSAHTGTHADSPFHYSSTGLTTESVDLTAYMGRCRVVWTKSPDAIRMSDLEGIDLSSEERLLFKTPRPLADDEWQDDFAYLDVEVARALAAHGIRLVGLDTPSVDPMTSKTLDAHKALLAGNVSILESLDLTHAPDGIYELIALPLKIAGGDSSPVRAILRPWNDS